MQAIEGATAHPAQEAGPAGTPHHDRDQGFFGNALQSIGDFGRGVNQEGLGALLDPSGAVDRQRAQRELGGMFQVRTAEQLAADPNHAQNQVTQEQFQQIAHQYSDIRMDRTDIHFNTQGLSDRDAGQYRRDMMGDLASIMQTSGGRDLIGNLAHNTDHHTTTLSPLFQKDAQGHYDPSRGLDDSNGFASPIHRDAATLHADGTAGPGSDARVRINPGHTIAPTDRDPEQDRWLPFRSDVLLYHELVHAMDDTHGTLNRGTTGADGDGVAWDSYQELAEHRAAGLGRYANEPISESAYRRARRAIGAGGGADARGGDATMPDRDTYAYHRMSDRPDAGGSTGSQGTARHPGPSGDDD